MNFISVLGICTSVLILFFCWIYYCAAIHLNQDLEKVVYDSLETERINEEPEIQMADKNSFVTEENLQVDDGEIEPNY